MKEYWRISFRVVGILLVLSGLLAAYWWIFKLAPLRHTLDPQWLSCHSQQEYWREVQSAIHFGMWLHDDGFTVGFYGDKSWADWIMKHVKPHTSMDCMGSPCHSATSMRFISNQDAGGDADAWLGWWEINKSKSQEQWIAEGFERRGLKVDVPPLPEQYPGLLTLLGNSKTNESAEISDELSYNAFRCLRDSGFDPVGFALSNQTVSIEIRRGLQEYAKRERRLPAALGVGILPFGEKDKDVDLSGMALPPIVTTRFQIIACTLIFGLLLLGAGTTAWAFRN